MKPQLTQQELSAHYNNDEIMVVAYKLIYQIKYSHAVSEYIMQKVYRSYADLPLTRRGRYIAMTADKANALLDTPVFVSI